MKDPAWGRMLAWTLISSSVGCSYIPVERNSPINQFNRFWGIGWSDGYHECDPRLRQPQCSFSGCGPGIPGSFGCCGQSSASVSEPMYQVHEIVPTPSNAPSNQPTQAPVPSQSLPQLESNAPPPPQMNPEPALPMEIPLADPREKKSLLREKEEIQAELDRQEPTSPSDRKAPPTESSEELKAPLDSSPKDLIPEPSGSEPSVPQGKPSADDDLLTRRLLELNSQRVPVIATYPQGVPVSVPQAPYLPYGSLQANHHQGNFHPNSHPQANVPQGNYPQFGYPQASYPQASYPQASYPQAGPAPGGYPSIHPPMVAWIPPNYTPVPNHAQNFSAPTSQGMVRSTPPSALMYPQVQGANSAAINRYRTQR